MTAQWTVTKTSEKDAVEVRLSIKGPRPPVWRRILVRPDTTLDELHRIVQIVFGGETAPHHFKVGRDLLAPSDPGYRAMTIGGLDAGDTLEHRPEGKDGQTCRIRVLCMRRARLDELPMLIDGMRTLGGPPGADPRDIDEEAMGRMLRRLRRYDVLVPNEEGLMVEPWQASSISGRDDLHDSLMRELAKRMPLSKRAEARLRPSQPLEPVARKVEPGTPVELKVKLRDMPVPVWRRLLVPSETTFHALHQAIQASFGWQDCHLYEFMIGDTIIESFDSDDFGDVPFSKEAVDSRLLHLRDIMGEKGWSIGYAYDFGDGWYHEVKVAKVHPPQPYQEGFELLGGSGACPPEDCGGPYGYRALIEALQDPDHPEHADMEMWFGADRLDLKDFDIGTARERLRHISRYI